MHRYLLVDDNPPIRLNLRSSILEADHAATFKESESGSAALAIAADWHPNVVFTSMRLADRESGLALVQELLRRDPSAVIVLCTSMPGTHLDVTAALSAGAFAHLPKPVRLDAVKHIINQIEVERGQLRRIR